MLGRSRSNVSRQRAMASTRRRSRARAIAGPKIVERPKPKVSDTGGGLRPPKVRRPRLQIDPTRPKVRRPRTGGGMKLPTRRTRRTSPRRPTGLARSARRR